jgi:hypothetical protein
MDQLCYIIALQCIKLHGHMESVILAENHEEELIVIGELEIKIQG